MSKDMLGPLPRAIANVPNSRHGIILDMANRLNENSESGDAFHADLAKFARSWQKKPAMAKPRILSLISAGQTIEIGETDGKETLAKAQDVFTGYVDPDFQNWGLDVSGKPTQKSLVEVHEMIGDANFNGIFNDLGRPLAELVLTQAQIKRFARDNRNWLRTDGYATFFLFKENDEFCVARVSVYDDGQLRVRVHRFGCGGVWFAGIGRRVVVPQQILGA